MEPEAAASLCGDLRVVAAIPCFNTQHAIAEVVSKVRKYISILVVINDGSADQTAEVAASAGATVVNQPVNKGYGEAIQSCFQAGKDADVLVIIDGDGQHDPDEIPSLLEPILRGEADLVVGSRFLSKDHTVPGYRAFGIKVITFLWNFGSRVKVTDTQSGFRAYNRNVMNSFSFSEKGMGISIEILEQARRCGARIQEVPISCTYPSSKIELKAVRHGLGVALSVVKIRARSLLHGPRKK